MHTRLWHPLPQTQGAPFGALPGGKQSADALSADTMPIGAEQSAGNVHASTSAGSNGTSGSSPWSSHTRVSLAMHCASLSHWAKTLTWQASVYAHSRVAQALHTVP